MNAQIEDKSMDNIFHRVSIRQFQDKPVEKEKTEAKGHTKGNSIVIVEKDGSDESRIHYV